jgi:hypothetical protein
MRRDERARLTLPDLAYVLASIAFLGALYPVFWDSVQGRLGELSTGTVYLLQLVLPLALLVLLYVIYIKATAGVTN